MRIATWNINGLRARLDFVKRWLGDRAPDVVGLQELKLSDDKFPHAEFESLGYRAVTHGQKSWNGVAILARHPIELVRQGLDGQDEFGARLITARIAGDRKDAESDGLEFTTVYCPNGKALEHEDFPRKLAWFDALSEHWKRHHDPNPNRASVLCGDFNVCPSPLDSWAGERFDGHLFHTEAERERFAGLTGLGLVDLFRDVHPEEQAFSWWDYRGGAFHRKQGLRIDFLLATKPVRERLRHSEIDREYRKKQDGLTASDHAPVLADLD